jgi:hypothetical protein
LAHFGGLLKPAGSHTLIFDGNDGIGKFHNRKGIRENIFYAKVQTTMIRADSANRADCSHADNHRIFIYI